MNEHTIITSEPEMATETRDIGDACDLLCQTKSLMRMIDLAATANGVFADDRDGESLQWFVMYLDSLLEDVQAILRAEIDRGRVQ